MNSRQRLDDYLDGLRRRLRFAIFTRAGAALAGTIVIVLGVAVYLLNLSGFPLSGVVVTRLVLLFAVIALCGALLWLPLRRLQKNSGAEQFEHELPSQQGRIQTYLEQQARDSQASLLTDLLAEDALQRAESTPIEQVVSPRRIWIAGCLAAAGVVTLLVVLILSRSEWGYGGRYVLLGVSIPREAVPIRQIALKPGDVTMRRNADLKVQADIKGFKPDNVELFVKFDESDRWEQASMQHVKGDQYGFTLYAVRAPLSYYVRAGNVRSDEHAVRVVDVPRIDQMQLSYTYPEWTGLTPRVEKENRDIRAVADTQVKVSVQASEPLQDAVVVIDRDNTAMQSVANASSGALSVTKSAHYYVASRVAGELVALTDEYDIALIDDEAPSIEVLKPGRDARASSIEEVPVTVHAKDDFKIQNVELHYAVNGGQWQRVKLPVQGAETQTKTLLQLEELGGKTPLIPGDLITYYATTSDRKQSAQTDLYMVQVQPFERRFTEGQGGGGGGGGGGDNEEQQIAERQRDLLVATWNLDRAREQKRRTPTQVKESAQMLSGLQDKLAEQTKTLADRTRARASLETDARVKAFVESLEAAVKAMAPASSNLNELELQKAIPSEQQALQMLQRAEASFRDIQVARSQSGQGSGAARTSRDIAELYELEMDLSKSKYETEKELSQEAREQNVDEALAKLKELAKRQEQLAQQRQQQQQQQSNADRWKQEQLRREAEELRKRLQEIAQQQQLAQQNGQQQGGQQQGQQSGEQSGEESARQSGQQSGRQSGQQSGQQSGSQGGQDANAALRAMENALQAMRNAENAANPRAAEEASRNLRQAADRMQAGAQSDAARSSLAKAVDKLADQAKQLAAQQRKLEVDLHMALSGNSDSDSSSRMRRDGLKPDQARKWADQKGQMLSDLQSLEERLRATAQTQRRNAPQTSDRLATIGDELASVNVPSRISRTIIDLERGRADQSVLGEGLVTEALQNAASDLSEAAKLAAQEAEQQAQVAKPEALLTEVAQLRQALQAAQRGQPGGQNSGGENGGANGSQTQIARGAQSGGGGGSVLRGPNGWYGGRVGNLAEQQIGDGDLSRLNYNAIRQQLNALQNRIAAGTITQADLEALRAVIPRVRYLARDPGNLQSDLARSIDNLELAALAAAEKSRQQTASRAGASLSGSNSDSETVAEYYRRLGK